MYGSWTGKSAYLVVLVTVVVEHLADEGAPHELGVSMFDLTERSRRFSRITTRTDNGHWRVLPAS